ncbi:MAG: bifunctional phosphoribosylaminoimidazolecarboxamide formyltransferase/IMP cyclohydrolase [Bacillota bacterium]
MKKALISVSDKTDIVHFANTLADQGYEILSTGGTKKVLEEAGIKVTSVDAYTGFPEILDGRVKTLHPKVHGGVLASKDNPSHMKAIKDHGIDRIDLVVVNLYPFKETIANPDVTLDEAIEQIDIGGPSMLRSAAKNFQSVTVVTDAKDYDRVLEEIKSRSETTFETRKYLAKKAFQKTAQYDAMIADYMTEESLPEKLTLTYDYHQNLRYGENPHQEAGVYKQSDNPYSILNAEILNGKALSYNNIQDANAAINILADFKAPSAVALKHMNPCGIASDDTDIVKAYKHAYQSDTVSIFGGIVALNRKVTIELARELKKIFLEIVIAPDYTDDALKELKKKKNLRLLRLDTTKTDTDTMMVTAINGGILYQSKDKHLVRQEDLNTVTKLKPSEQELNDLMFAWKAVKHVKSNAIVITHHQKTVGIGAGQMNRVGAAHIALKQAEKNNHTEALTLASDAFFPFDDVVRLAKTYGVETIIQPGGSIRDEDSIKACDDLGIKMVFTGNRHFKH